MPESPRPQELGQLVELIASQQAHADRNIGYLGTDPAGIAAELEGLAPPWVTTARVLRADGRIVGVVLVEWDVELGRSWVIGPWVDAEGEAWRSSAQRLLDAALAQLPERVTKHELFGDAANHRLADLAAAQGWLATETNHALVADADVTAAWPAGAARLRRATPADVPAITPLHEAEFPTTYASAGQLVDGDRSGARIVLVAEVEGGVAGYAAGEIHEDGEGYIDFVAVDASMRGHGFGRELVMALTRRLLEQSPQRRVCLTVQDHRAPARALYERLGFRHDAALVGYRSWQD